MEGSRGRLERLACDRCHGHKLRCRRGPKDNQACQRCIKAGERCTYSPPLRLGRPANKSNPGAGSSSQSSSSSNKKGSVTRPNRKGVISSVIDKRHRRTPTPVTQYDRTTESSADISGTNSPAGRQDGGLPQTPNGRSSIPAGPQGRTNTDFGYIDSASIIVTTSSNSPTILVLPETEPAVPTMPETQPTTLTPVDSLITPMSMSSHTSPEKAFSTTDIEYLQDSPPAAIMQNVVIDHQPHTTTACNLHDFGIYTIPAMPPLAPQLEPNNSPHRQLLRLQRRLCEIPCASIMDEAEGLKLILGETTKASNILLEIITALTTSTYSQSGSVSQIDAATIFLVAACYAHILRNGDALATQLHHSVTSTSSDEGAFLGLPCVQIGSITSTSLVAPAIQTSMVVQFLSQSLSEIERRLPLLSRAVPTHPPPLHAPLGSSRIAEMVGAVNSDIANLAAHVNGTLSSILEML